MPAAIIAGDYFVDVASALDVETTMSVHRADGSAINVVETSDVSGLTATGWSPPVRERIALEGVPGDLFATVFRPSDFDASQSYAVVEALYPIPNDVWAPVRRWT